MLKDRCEWQREPEKENGILVGCDSRQEWLLEWWWERYSAENDFPVTFIDFGMTQQARNWCQHRGEVISVSMDSSFVKSKEEICLGEANMWEVLYGSTLWEARSNWFKKPFACLHSVYKKTIWIDLDCEILRSIGCLFSACNAECPLALVREHGTENFPKLDPRVYYNGGVIVFFHGSEIIRKWAEDSILRNGHFWSDDNLLSALISEHLVSVMDLPDLFNWNFMWGVNIHAIIFHWVGRKGKDYIDEHGGIKHKLRPFFQNHLS